MIGALYFSRFKNFTLFKIKTFNLMINNNNMYNLLPFPKEGKAQVI